MRLEAGHAVDHVDAGVFQPPRPVDVPPFVEAGLQLHQGRDLLAVLGGPGQGADDRRIAAGAIERLLDGQHVRVFGRLLDQLHHRIEALVGVEQQHVVVLDGLPQIVGPDQVAGHLRRPVVDLQLVESRPVDDLHQRRSLLRAVDFVDLPRPRASASRPAISSAADRAGPRSSAARDRAAAATAPPPPSPAAGRRSPRRPAGPRRRRG